jgi:hypothetical protein
MSQRRSVRSSVSTNNPTSPIRKSRRGRTQGQPGQDEAAAEEWKNLAGRGVRRFQLRDPPQERRASQSGEPSSFPADGATGGNKKRNSHDSAVAVRGSVADPNTPHVNGRHLQEDGGHTDAEGEDGKERGIEDEGDLSSATLLLQQQWADRRSMALDAIPMADVVPGSKYTRIQFLEPSRRPGRGRGVSDPSGVPPISQTPPVVSPSSSHPNLTAGGGQRLESAQRSNSNISSEGGGPFTLSPMSVSPADEQPGGHSGDTEVIEAALRRSNTPSLRLASSIQRQILETTEELTEEGANTNPATTDSGSSKHPSRAGSEKNLVQATLADQEDLEVAPHSEVNNDTSRPSSPRLRAV